MKLVQILLPLRDNQGRPFKRSLHDRVRQELTDEFGGLTAYVRSPAHGVWKTAGKEQRDEIIIIEIMSRHARRTWWKRYRRGRGCALPEAALQRLCRPGAELGIVQR